MPQTSFEVLLTAGLVIVAAQPAAVQVPEMASTLPWSGKATLHRGRPTVGLGSREAVA